MRSVSVGKVGIIGLGSIGRRHVRVLKSLVPDLRIEAFRTRRGGIPGPFEDVIDLNRDAFFSSGYDLVVIANPSAMHLDTLRDVLRAGIANTIVVEKPFCLSEHAAEAAKLLDESPGTKVLPGNTLRFHPAIASLKTTLAAGTLGSALECHAHFGTFMPAWHPYEDYRGTYAARRELGGGVLLTSIHELDLVHHLFGTGTVVGAIVGQFALRDTDVDDAAHLLLRLERCPIANISLSFFERPPDRWLKVVFENGVWIWRFGQPTVRVTAWEDKGPLETLHDVDPSVDAMYVAMWRAVLANALHDFELDSVFASLKTAAAARAFSGNH